MQRREYFFFLAFVIGMVTGWIVLDQFAGGWFEQQARSASSSQLISLCALKIALTLTAGALALTPYVFCTVDIAENLEMRARNSFLTDFSTFVTVDAQSPASLLDAELSNQFRPPRQLS